MNKNILIPIFAISILFITGCAKDVTVIIKDEPAVVRIVSFSKDLVPIFTKNCALSGCHVSGAKSPDLEADKAYTSLMGDKALVNVANPTASEIYLRLTGQLSPAMPMGKPSNPSNINGLILAWIKQGAKKN